MTGVQTCALPISKINIQLKMVGLRPDGYHSLRTLMQTVSLFDSLSLYAEPAAFSVSCRCKNDPSADQPVSAPSDETNLVVRAARRFNQSAPLNYALTFELTKRIPVGAGLGGGSSDAAGAIRLLQALTNATDSTAASIARDVGCDVPFFLKGGGRWMIGRGDEPAASEPPPAQVFVIIYPGFSVSTPAVYSKYDSLTDNERFNNFGIMIKNYPDVWAMGADNDLFPAAIAVEPRLRVIARKIIELSASDSPAQMSMSGSGSSFFVSYRDKKKAERLADACRSLSPDARAYVCEPVVAPPAIRQSK